MAKRKNLFKRRVDYTTPDSRPAEGQPIIDGEAPPPAEEDILQWNVRTFFDQLFKVSVDEATLIQAREAFKVVAAQVKLLDNDSRSEVIRQTDFFVGRVKSNLEAVLQEWYRANK